MSPSHRPPPPSLNLLSSSSPARPVSTSPSPTHRHSQSPFRYVKESQTMAQKSDPGQELTSIVIDEKLKTPITGPHTKSIASRCQSPLPLASRQPTPYSRGPCLSSNQFYHHNGGQSPLYTRPRGLRITNLIKPWLPLIIYGITSFGFFVAIAFWKKEVFEGLDELSLWLRADEQFGIAVLSFLIFLTTFPPIPLYSTLIILSGYTFGPWTGAIISYCAALSGALVVFILSRIFLRNSINRWLACAVSIKRVVRAIEKRPKLLFLIRLAPYPYNVMNCLLAASSTLTLRTYTICTALSLFKVIIHTSVGASIHSFKDYNTDRPDSVASGEENGGNTIARVWTMVGVTLCIVILVYLSYVARRAVDEELDDESSDTEETVAFLSPQGSMGHSEADLSRDMVESPFSIQLGASSRDTLQLHDHGNRSNLNVGLAHGRDEEASIGL